MDFKKEIEKLLFSLKEMGIDRRTIEKDLGYSEKSIDQILSKGGNEKALGNIKRYYIEKSNTGKREVKPNVETPNNKGLDDLIEGNKNLSLANKDLAAANLELTLMLKTNSNSGHPTDFSQACLERIAEQCIGVRLFWKTKAEGLSILGNFLSETVKERDEGGT